MTTAATLVLGFVALSMSVPEFVALQRMPPDALRARFDLPRDCEPRLTASADPPSRVLVVVSCASPVPNSDLTRVD
jgi:hypothetical protein